MYFDVHRSFLGHDHVSMQTADMKQKLQSSHYNGEKKVWNWDIYVSLYKKQHTIIESIEHHDCTDIVTGTKV